MTTRTDPRTTILDLLAGELRLYQRLITVAEAKRAALLHADVDGLLELVREMEGLTVQVERLEDERLAAASYLTGGTEDTVSALLPYFAGDARWRLEELRDALRAALTRLRNLNESNNALVRQALTFSDQWLRLIRAASPSTYAASGVVTAQQTVTRQWQV
jgi:flagellar biosynthesis/type III secretory pathway chaperone